MSAWSHLPNAVHIDRVLASLKKHPEIWGAAWNAARDVAWSAAYCAAWSAARDEAYGAARDEARSAARAEAYDAAWSAILALIAYDDCDQYLSMSSEQLRAWSLLTEQPAAVLLLPAVVAFERIKELESV
jgi:hypothetical protein